MQPPPLPPPSPWPAPQPLSRTPSRPPPPPWPVWIAFLFGPGLLLALPGVFGGGGFHPEVLLGAAMGGVLLGLPFIGGLALATRFFSGPISRIIGGLVFGVTVIVACAAALFAGCMCLMKANNGFH